MNEEFKRIRHRKVAARKKDEAQIESGAYSILPMETAKDPQWRADLLRSVAESMNRPKTRPSIPGHLLRSNPGI